MADDSTRERDWYDIFDLIFKVVVAFIGGWFSYVQWNASQVTERHDQDAKQIERTQAQQAANGSRLDSKRALMMQFILQAADHSASHDEYERNRGLALLNIVDDDKFYHVIDLDDASKTDARAIVKLAKSYNYTTAAQLSSAAKAPSVAETAANCIDLLTKSKSRVITKAAGSQCWVYLGEYDGKFNGKACEGPGSWASRYLQFDAPICPADLIGKSMTVRPETGAIYARSGPASELGVQPVVGGVYPGELVTIDGIRTSANGQNYLWGRVSDIKPAPAPVHATRP
jgi:hypothetical protein